MWSDVSPDHEALNQELMYHLGSKRLTAGRHLLIFPEICINYESKYLDDGDTVGVKMPSLGPCL